jgi:hypothetical protein
MASKEDRAHPRKIERYPQDEGLACLCRLHLRGVVSQNPMTQPGAALNLVLSMPYSDAWYASGVQ